MSFNYAEGLSPYEEKGKLGLPEKFDSDDQIKAKCTKLAKWIEEATHIVVHTGAGISTSAGIPDFRGPKGVWTLEEKGEKPDINISFNEAKPTKTHMALVALANAGRVHHVISQNIDGLHLRSGLERKFLSEVHGNMFLDRCSRCSREWVRKSCVMTVGQKEIGKRCTGKKSNNLACRGVLRDTILDWEHELPELDLRQADLHARSATLSICFGTTLQIVPAGNLPLLAKKNGGRLVICNLQPTKHDKKADLIINAYVDTIAEKLLKILHIEPIEYTSHLDPSQGKGSQEWTINPQILKDLETSLKRKRRPKRLPARYRDAFISLDFEGEEDLSGSKKKRQGKCLKMRRTKKIKVITECSTNGQACAGEIRVKVSGSVSKIKIEQEISSLSPSPHTVCIPKPKRPSVQDEIKKEKYLDKEDLKTEAY